MVSQFRPSRAQVLTLCYAAVERADKPSEYSYSVPHFLPASVSTLVIWHPYGAVALGSASFDLPSTGVAGLYTKKEARELSRAFIG